MQTFMPNFFISSDDNVGSPLPLLFLIDPLPSTAAKLLPACRLRREPVAASPTTLQSLPRYPWLGDARRGNAALRLPAPLRAASCPPLDPVGLADLPRHHRPSNYRSS